MPSPIPARGGEHGEVFTRRWVVELILDLVGYRAEHDLGGSVIVEPACGRGAFLVPIVERLAESCARHGRSLADMGPAIRGLDLLDHNVELARKAVTARLLELGELLEVAEQLSKEWVAGADFLLAEHGSDGLPQADFVVGNPPYIRLEDVPADTGRAYRLECSTMRGRADIYVGFFEKGLALLAGEGRLAFICADRWMHNQYGQRLRAHIAANYAVDVVVVMHDVDAFEHEVSAYPAITVLRNGRQGSAKVVEARDGFDEEAGQDVVRWLDRGRGTTVPMEGKFATATLDGWFQGSGHWPTGSPREFGLIADLEERFAPLEDRRTGTRVGIGVATGCDDVFVVGDGAGVEPSRLMPLLTAADVATGVPRWSGKYLVNPWEGGRLVDLADYPGIASYLDSHGERVRSRHVARRRPSAWYRTIDRVAPDLQGRPKLLLPDLKAASHPVLEPGECYPHHNLYYVVSDTWDLELLGGLLLSDIANLFVGAYCVKMRGGTYRFQAQYLRKIRVPTPDSVDGDIAAAIVGAFRARDRDLATEAAAELYGIDRSDLPRLSAV